MQQNTTPTKVYIVQSRIKRVIHREHCEEVQLEGCLICFLKFMLGSYKGACFVKYIDKGIVSMLESGVAKKHALGKQ